MEMGKKVLTILINQEASHPGLPFLQWTDAAFIVMRRAMRKTIVLTRTFPGTKSPPKDKQLSHHHITREGKKP
eukprot:13752110-Ditylum_brightwellii.AAC.1